MSQREDEEFDDLEPLPGRPGPLDLPELPEPFELPELPELSELPELPGLPEEISERSDLAGNEERRPAAEPPHRAEERERAEPSRAPAERPPQAELAASAPVQPAREESRSAVTPSESEPSVPAAPAAATSAAATGGATPSAASSAAQAEGRPLLLEEEAPAPLAAAATSAGAAPAAGGAKEEAGRSGGRAQPAGSSGRRELDRAPLELRKASVFVLVGSIFPWGEPQNLGLGSIVEKLLCFLAVWIFYQSHVLKHGEKASGLVASLGRKNPLVPMIAAGLIALVGLAPIASSGAAGSFWASVALIMEKTFLLLAGYTFVHIYDYERGGKFNPMFPLLFLFPAVGGLLAIITRIVPRFGEIPLQAGAALSGAVAIGLGGLIACHTMYVAMKEAKVHGEARRQAAQEARRAAREARRGAGAGPGTDPPAGRER